MQAPKGFSMQKYIKTNEKPNLFVIIIQDTTSPTHFLQKRWVMSSNEPSSFLR